MYFYHCNHHCAIVSLHLCESKLSTIFYKIYWSLIAVLAMSQFKVVKNWEKLVISEKDQQLLRYMIPILSFAINCWCLLANLQLWSLIPNPALQLFSLPSFYLMLLASLSLNLFFSYSFSFCHFISLVYAHSLIWALQERAWEWAAAHASIPGVWAHPVFTLFWGGEE